jgi:alkanesulfonate monooxygenase SsuD/methylene tetrahydromethanopterin reductase-like flavin-dependent oxidoreductase (luciferase family)
MKFGIFYEHQLPRPWAEGSEQQLFQDALDQVELADRLGIDYAWEVEHHFLEEYSHSSAPEVFLAACSQRTRRIRLGHGIVLMPPGYNHPARVAERIATLDLVSNGRVEFGTGESASRAELEGFGIDPAERRAMWRETVEQVASMMAMDPYPGFQGKYFSMPCRNVLPKPVQRPHPPLWVTASNPGTVEVAGRLGIGAAMFNFADPELSRPLVEAYKAAVAKAEPVGAFVHDKIMTIAPAMCLEDGEEARTIYSANSSRVAAHFSVYFDTIPAFAERLAGEKRPIAQTRLRELIRETADSGAAKNPFADASTEPDYLRQNGLCVGTPEQVIATLRRFEAVGFDQVVLVPVLGFDTPHEKTLESVRLLGEKVLPAFRGRSQERDGV